MHEMWADTQGCLYDTNDHLFYRDHNYFNDKSPNGENVYWSRGNGWVMGGIVRVGVSATTVVPAGSFRAGVTSSSLGPDLQAASATEYAAATNTVALGRRRPSDNQLLTRGFSAVGSAPSVHPIRRLPHRRCRRDEEVARYRSSDPAPRP